MAAYLTKLRRLGVNIVGAPLDDDGHAHRRARADPRRSQAQGHHARNTSARSRRSRTRPARSCRSSAAANCSRCRRKYGVPIFEDECYADLTWGGMGRRRRCTRWTRSRSSISARSRRPWRRRCALGYVVAALDVHEPHASPASARPTAAPARSNRWSSPNISRRISTSHVDGLTDTLHEKLDTMVEAVEREFGTSVEPWRPKGGIFLWMKLPDQVDVRKLVSPPLKAGIAFNPGPEWAGDGEAPSRSCASASRCRPRSEIRDGVAAFARVCFEETGIPEQSGNRLEREPMIPSACHVGRFSAFSCHTGAGRYPLFSRTCG